jgi:hypothetical protein
MLISVAGLRLDCYMSENMAMITARIPRITVATLMTVGRMVISFIHQRYVIIVETGPIQR